jgi:hypothetical protein
LGTPTSRRPQCTPTCSTRTCDAGSSRYGLEGNPGDRARVSNLNPARVSDLRWQSSSPTGAPPIVTSRFMPIRARFMLRRSLATVGVWAVGVGAVACDRTTRTPGSPDGSPTGEASLAGDAVAGPISEPGPSVPASDASAPPAPECVANVQDVHGCDFDSEACINGRCRPCGPGTKPLLHECAKACDRDVDCPRGLVCVFVTGAKFVCQKPAPKKTCPPGHIWLRNSGACVKTCKGEHDCPRDMCCLTDPNAPVPICMSRCL